MTLKNLDKVPFPWFGGKRQAAPTIWAALGDVPHYVEPFAGSLAVLLCRPHLANRPYHSETVNDLDGLLCNAWRAMRLHPDETAEAASWPVSECDLHARHQWLLRWRAEHSHELLEGDPDWCDPRAAGYWIWGQSCWIGSGWCSGRGPWVVDEGGRLVRRPGKGRAGASRQRPHLGDDGQGVNRPQARETGVGSAPPAFDPDRLVGDDTEFHAMAMPEIRRWFQFLAARLRHVRILCGDWQRAVTTGATLSLPVRQGHGPCGVFLDPPYSDAVRDANIYTEDQAGAGLSEAVRAWCMDHGADPRYRIVLAGFTGEGHEALAEAGWREVEWFKSGFLRGGMANLRGAGCGAENQKRERLWLSPHCLAPEAPEAGGGGSVDDADDGQIGMGW